MARIPLFPLGNILCPDGVLHLRVFEIRYLDMIKRCLEDRQPFGIVILLVGQEVRKPDALEVLAPVGTLARIEHWQQPDPALYELRCRGGQRIELADCERGRFGLWTGRMQAIDADPVVPVPGAMREAVGALGRLIAGLQQQGYGPAEMPVGAPYRLDEAGWVADRWCELLPLAPAEKARLLGLRDPLARLSEVSRELAARGLI
ncbi:LON peptidase substrate-binding domain-containing protein [Bordetella holmesii]|uniref:ATP-dependent protease La (LON) domain protein n=2 Tax=Bordetella holmesii TaxID=35814 RepID=A0A158MA28_9BORD|nr:LON peptidase substrate-binding domain-containing protein [Bordetella holmesii]AHV91518.1 ATP-dependent protease La domain protein [Bordetella holmesii ATCC 51541]AIT28402.1 ATP-dependent protease La domain protein [Bordetella holmesii 44057]EWM41192.1 ATP-dependent protease La domain protein [Bordetella holmesii 35009]EWM44317.1 ATP-dependent protease La domain protein [Bordetella holmesii 41130]EWM45083.1 ATP-dependent protease La domain protein [Bordetella holmesii 70147]